MVTSFGRTQLVSVEVTQLYGKIGKLNKITSNQDQN